MREREDRKRPCRYLPFFLTEAAYFLSCCHRSSALVNLEENILPAIFEVGCISLCNCFAVWGRGIKMHRVAHMLRRKRKEGLFEEVTRPINSANLLRVWMHESASIIIFARPKTRCSNLCQYSLTICLWQVINHHHVYYPQFSSWHRKTWKITLH